MIAHMNADLEVTALFFDRTQETNQTPSIFGAIANQAAVILKAEESHYLIIRNSTAYPEDAVFRSFEYFMRQSVLLWQLRYKTSDTDSEMASLDKGSLATE